MLANKELDRLTRVRPEILDRTESVVDVAEEDVILRHILQDCRIDRAIIRVGPASSRPARSIFRRSLGAAVACVVLAALITVATVSSTGDHRPTVTSPSQSTPSSATQTSLAGPTIQLAGYSFRLPAGFSASRSACTDLARALGPSTRMLGSDPFASAASSEGGCIEAVLAAGPPATSSASATPVAVGPYKGFVVLVSSTATDLYVEIPAASAHHDLILFGKGLSPEQLVAIARSGLPKSIGKLQTCVADCG
jgi:hypothetical protein